MRGVFYGGKYTPLYKKGIKETQNKPMETTARHRKFQSDPTKVNFRNLNLKKILAKIYFFFICATSQNNK